MSKILDSIRIALYGAIVAILLLFYQAWEKEHAPVVTTTTTPAVTAAANNNYIPNVSASSDAQTKTIENTNPLAAPSVTTNNRSLIHVTTDTYEADIDTVGGNITQIKLLKFPAELHSTQSFLLLNDLPETRYLAQSGLLNAAGPDTSKGQATYTTDKKDYVLAPDQQQLEVNLHWKNPQGIQITKTFVFKRGQYDINVDYQINNQSKQTWDGNLYLQLLRKNAGENSHQSHLSTTATYFGAAISSPDKRFQKITFSDMNNKNLDQTIQGGWAAMVQHYFVSAWVPDNTSSLRYFSHVTQDGLYTIGMISPKMSVEPGQTITTHSQFYAGPAIASDLDKVSPTLKLTIDYGWFWFI